MGCPPGFTLPTWRVSTEWACMVLPVCPTPGCQLPLAWPSSPRPAPAHRRGERGVCRTGLSKGWGSLVMSPQLGAQLAGASAQPQWMCECGDGEGGEGRATWHPPDL